MTFSLWKAINLAQILAQFAFWLEYSNALSTWKAQQFVEFSTSATRTNLEKIDANEIELVSKNVLSQAHCFGNSHQVDAWRTKSCMYKNVCFDLRKRQFVFFSSGVDLLPGNFPENVSAGVFNKKWETQYDASVNVRPQIVTVPFESYISKPWLKIKTNDVYVASLPFAPSNIGHLIWDDFLTWYGVTLAVGGKTIRPLWYNILNDPPWATCDWVRQHSGPGHNLGAAFPERCVKNIKKWMPYLLGNLNQTVLPETSVWLKNEKYDGAPIEGVCLENVIIGSTTAFSNQGPALHGFRMDDKAPFAVGKALQFWGFRKNMMDYSHVNDVEEMEEVLVFFSEKSSDRINMNFDPFLKAIKQSEDELNGIIQRFSNNKNLKLVVRQAELSTISPKEQMRIAATSSIFVTAAGGGAFTAQFLPRGAGLILFHAQDESVHKGYVDYKIWNFISSWVRPHWIVLGRTGGKLGADAEEFMKILKKEIVSCLLFMKYKKQALNE